MKNKTVKMIFAVAALLVCCGAYVGVKAYVTRQEEAQAQTEEGDAAASVFEASADEIQAVSFMIDRNEVTFEKADSGWEKQDEETFPVNQTTLDSAVSALAKVESDRVLENAEDLSQYGLDEPSNTIKITTKDAGETDGAGKADTENAADNTEVTTLRVGDLNTSSNQYYVSKNEDRNTVYLVDSSVVEPFTKGLYDYAQGEEFPVVGDTSKVNKITVTGNEENSYTLEKEEDTGFWYIDGDEKADSAKASSLAAALGSMAYDSFVDYDCEDNSQYGLNDPYTIIEVDYQEEKMEEATEEAESTDAPETSESKETDMEEAEEPEMVDKHLKIDVGNESEDGGRYVSVNDSKQIYTMSADALSTYLDKTEADFWDMAVKYLAVNNLEKLVVEYNDVKHEINVSRETSESEDGETEENITYLLDGEETDETTFTTFYNKLNNMTAERRLAEEFESQETPEMVITYTSSEGEDKVEYYSYDTNYYAVNVDEKTYLVNKMTVKSMMEAYENVIGEKEE